MLTYSLADTPLTSNIKWRYHLGDGEWQTLTSQNGELFASQSFLKVELQGHTITVLAIHGNDITKKIAEATYTFDQEI
jgi:hypothetical protein